MKINQLQIFSKAIIIMISKKKNVTKIINHKIFEYQKNLKILIRLNGLHSMKAIKIENQLKLLK